MKTAFLTTALALAASSAQASLTESNTTYNLLSVFVRGSLGAATDVVVDANDLWLSQQFQTVVVKAEAALEAEKEDFTYYADLLTGLYDQATAYDAATFQNLSKEVDEKASDMSSAMLYSPQEWTDVVFDIAEQILPEAKNETFSTWIHSERKAMETLATDGASTTRLVIGMDVFIDTLFESGDEISGLFTNKLLEVYEQTGDEYAMEFLMEDYESSEEKEETKKPSVKKAKKTTKNARHGKHSKH